MATRKGLGQANTFRTNNNTSTGYGIVYADEVSGHRTVGNLTALYALHDWQLSASGDNTDNDAIGQLWYVVDADSNGNGCYYQLKDWNKRNEAAGWSIADYTTKAELGGVVENINTNIATKANAQDVTNAIGELQDSIKNIAVTGGASTATAVTFDNAASGMTAVTAQAAIDELSSKISEEKTRVDSISSVLSKPSLITSVSHQLHYNGSGITKFASLSLESFKKDDIINIKFKSIGEYNGKVRIYVFNSWIDIPSSTDRERIFKTLLRMEADGIGKRIEFYLWNEKIDADISINVFTKEDGYDNITTKSLEHENIIDLNIFENRAWLNGNRLDYPDYKCTSIDIQKGCKYKIQTTSMGANCDAITFVDKDNTVLGKIEKYGGSQELVVNGSNLPLPIGSVKILISCEKSSDISVISAQSILDDLKTKVDSLSLSSKVSSNYFSALKGKKLGIVGDSISTYEGWIPNGYDVYYRNGGILPSVENTYWKIAINELGMVVGNCSWSGSYVYGDSTSTSNANIGTSTKRINDLSADGINPDIVLVYMGTNDFLFGIDKGEFNMSSDYADGNISTFMNAYALLLTKIRKAYPNCKILCGTMPLQFASSPDLYVNNNWTSVRTKGESISEWNNAIKEIAKAFGCGVVDFATCAINSHSSTLEDRCHPNIKGHKLMAERLIKDLLNC